MKNLLNTLKQLCWRAFATRASVSPTLACVCNACLKVLLIGLSLTARAQTVQYFEGVGVLNSPIVFDGPTHTILYISEEGFEAEIGCDVEVTNDQEFELAIGLPPGEDDLHLNWTLTRTFDESGNEIGAAKSFFDESGRALQSQVKQYSTANVMAAQSVRDRFGREVINALPAPIFRTGFAYAPDFIQDTNGNPYNHTHFDTEDKKYNPDPIGTTERGTLGWYYSFHNNAEPYTPLTDYPYSRTEFFDDGTGETRYVAAPGNHLQLGSGHEATGQTFTVLNELNGHYTNIYHQYVFSDWLDLRNQGTKTVSIDANGKESISLYDKQGKLLAAGLPDGEHGVQLSGIEMEMYLPEIHFVNVALDPQDMPIQDTVRLKIEGNAYVQVYDRNNWHPGSVNTDGLLYNGFPNGKDIILSVPNQQEILVQIRSKEAFTYKVLVQQGQHPEWTTPAAVQYNGQFTGSGYDFYIPKNGGQSTPVSFFDNFGGLNPDIRVMERLTDNPIYSGPLQGAANLNLPGGFYTLRFFDNTANPDQLTAYPVCEQYMGTVEMAYTYTAGDWSYHYYDAAGRLVASISPNGLVQLLEQNVPYSDIDKTTYEYNHQGWLMAVNEKDAGRTEYRYRKDGSIRFSQNEKQRHAQTSIFSYIHYDVLGRPVESGEYSGALQFATDLAAILENTGSNGLVNGTTSDWVRTAYDLPDENFQAESQLDNTYIQDFMIGGVSYLENEQVKTWYSYDEFGRVTWMAQRVYGLNKTFTLDYTYDYPGNVLEVAWQKGTEESFHHHYTYDADQRLYQAFTSTDGENKTLQATYQYYLHGPLKRVELAGDLQGIDYLYTINGWLKAINHTNPSLDMGQDGPANGFHPDVFGMGFEYFSGDFPSHQSAPMETAIAGEMEDQYTGNLKTVHWRTPFPDAGTDQQPVGYAYHYDNRYQLSEAVWGAPNFAQSDFVLDNASRYRVNGLTYDANGNIGMLQRHGQAGQMDDDFTYSYAANSNRLQQVSNYASYGYNELGQMVHEAPVAQDAPDKYMTYDVTGKVTAIYEDANHAIPRVKFAYDERGFRLKKEAYNSDDAQNPIYTTWYIRDASGALMAAYDDRNPDGSQANAVSLKEQPVYGAGKLGIHYTQRENTCYELTDHLGNVRAVVAEPGEPLHYLATLENENLAEEQQYFELDNVPLSSSPVPPFDKVARLDNVNRLGPSITLMVMPGDRVDIAVKGAYEDTQPNGNGGNELLLMALSAFTGEAITAASEIYQNIIATNPQAATLLSFLSDNNNTAPRGYLNYLLFDHNLNFKDGGFVRIPEAGALGINNTDFAELNISLDNITHPGYLYIYTGNESELETPVYFNDLAVTHTPGIIQSLADYYPFGSEMAARQFSRMGRQPYRFGYQGQFAEKDEETGWNAFELRQYDSRIGRWLSTDPYRQYYSPYVGMGNNPVNSVDPDGGCDDCGWYKNKEKTQWFESDPLEGWSYVGGEDYVFDSPFSLDEVTVYSLKPEPGKNPYYHNAPWDVKVGDWIEEKLDYKGGIQMGLL